MSFASTIFWVSAGPVIWATHFLAIYGVTTLACAQEMSGAVPWIVGAATLVAGSIALVVMLKCLREKAEFVRWIGAGNAGLALVAILWEALPALTVPPCA